MSPARASAPSTVSFFGGRVPPWSLPQPFIPPVPPVPYVLPGTVGYQGLIGSLTPYSPPGSGLPGEGDLPDGTWQWESYGIRNNNPSITLDHVYIYGGIYFTGNTATITKSILQAGTGTELAAFSGKGAGGTLNFTDSTFEWAPDTAPEAPVDVGVIFDDGSLPYVYNLLRCACSGAPQGIGPVTGNGSQIINSTFFAVQNNPSGPNHLDGIFNEGANDVLIQGCYVVSPTSSDATSALFWQSAGPITGCVVTGNYLQGGSYTFYNENGSGLVVTDNTFGGGFNGDALNVVADGGSIAVWTGNIHPNGTVVPSP